MKKKLSRAKTTDRPRIITDIKATILQQREELQRLRKLATMVREQENNLKSALNSPLIKVIRGPRRAGKSMLAVRALANYDHGYLNFDDDQIAGVENTNVLLSALKEVYPDARYILFDEIQNVPNWELFVSKLQRAGFNLVLTGSNAHLLGGELATALTGRHEPIELLPLSLREFFRTQQDEGSADTVQVLKTYLEQGGFPEPLIHGLDTKQYLRTLFESVLYKDIIKRHKIRNVRSISDLGYFLANNPASLIAVERLSKTVGIGSTATTQRLLGFLEQTYLFFQLEPYSHKVRLQLRSPRKSYVIDPGLATALSRSTTRKEGHMLENVVFLELIRRGYRANQTLFYYRTTKGNEVDFLLRKGHVIEELVQVAFSLVDPGTRAREIRALLDASRELGCKRLRIITFQDSEEDTVVEQGCRIRVEGVLDWANV